MRRLTFVAALAAAALLPTSLASAYDYGVDLTNDSNVLSDQAYSVTQRDRVKPWLSMHVGENSDLYLSGFYQFMGVFNEDGSSTLTPLRLDFDRSEFTGSLSALLGPSSVFRWSVGRIGLADFSGWLVSGLYDGGRAELALGNLTLSATAAYTGLLYKKDALVALDADDAKINADDQRYFAPRRALGSLGARFTELLPGHDLGLEAWGQADLEGGSSATHGLYLEPFVEGSLGRPMKWRAWAAYEYSLGAAAQSALAAGFLFRYSVPELKSLRATASAAWASGPAGSFEAFTPFRQVPLSTASIFVFQNAFIASLDLSVSPFRGISTGLTGTAFFRTSEALIFVTGMRTSPSGSYLGAEADLAASVRLSSDLTLTANGGIFLPNTSTYYASATPPRWTASVIAGFSM
jgi:hypothetical protein